MRRCGSSVPARFSAIAFAAIAGSLPACATTTGLAWVNEPESGADLTPPAPPNESATRSLPARASESEPRMASNQAVAPAQPEASSRRLDHSITLGANDYDARAYGSPSQPAGGQASTIVNVYVTPGAMPYYGASYGYGGYGFGPSFATSSFVRTPAQSFVPTMRPGLDFAPPINHGPTFPYHTGPASPWESDRTRHR